MKRTHTLFFFVLALFASHAIADTPDDAGKAVPKSEWVHTYTQCGGDWADLPPDLTSALLVAVRAHFAYQAEHDLTLDPAAFQERLDARRRPDGALLITFSPSSMRVRDGGVTYVVDPDALTLRCTIRGSARDCE